jgi:hypothetical protein
MLRLESRMHDGERLEVLARLLIPAKHARREEALEPAAPVASLLLIDDLTGPKSCRVGR